MKLYEALPLLDAGKRIRNKVWDTRLFWVLYNEKICLSRDAALIPQEDILSTTLFTDGWEEYEEMVLHDIKWAVQQMEKGYAMRRKGWPTQKSIWAHTILVDKEDILAEDWELIDRTTNEPKKRVNIHELYVVLETTKKSMGGFHFSGVVIKSSSALMPVGTYSDSWRVELFKTYTGEKITL